MATDQFNDELSRIVPKEFPDSQVDIKTSKFIKCMDLSTDLI